MSRPLIPRPTLGDADVDSPQASQKPRKISTACGACKQRKTRCSGNSPCDACIARNSSCIFDAASDQRRKIANQKNIQDLVEAQSTLSRHQQLLGGIVAILRVGDREANIALVSTIKSGVDLSQLAAHVRNARRADPSIEEAFSNINFVIDGGEDLPSPTQLLTSVSRSSTSRGSLSDGIGENPPQPNLNSFLDHSSTYRSHE